MTLLTSGPLAQGFSRLWLCLSAALLICLLHPTRAQCQAAAAQENTQGLWLHYLGDHPIAPRYELHLEAMESLAGRSFAPDFFFFRPGIRRTIVGSLSTMLAYSYFERYPADTGSRSNLQEHRFSQDVQWTHALLRSQMTHRFRYEERLRSSNTAGQQKTWAFAQRARYRIAADVPAPWRADKGRPAYFNLYDEIFLHTQPPQGRDLLDENQTGAGVGWRIRSGIDLEAGYVHIYNANPGSAIGTHHHLLRITLVSRLPFHRNR